ncbi:hypothetical protein AVEN_254154-1 [Araneus ventricosus]|uniref:Uncharacterized protein n=1 Tax=Araneus ventricosus TaxID=182803 RepID=A0A4Y2JWW1_ARAVE|nr:hypothetical protein AVEN_254154-1 [Araneus ventricosus]
MKLSAICHPLQTTPAGKLFQYIFDNVEFNVATHDGLNNFHSMGGIKCIAPSCALTPADSIKRLKSVPTAEEVDKPGVLEPLAFENRKGVHCSKLLFRTLTC